MKTTKKDSATPRPWSIREGVSRDGDLWIDGKDGMMLASVSSKNMNEDYCQERNANASLIVKAVNNHEALLEACRLAESWLNDLRREPSEGKQRASLISRETDALYALRQAIAKAEGR